MQERYELVQKGFRILHPLMAGYIGLEMNREYHNSWWQEVLTTLNDQRDLPENGDYMTLIDSLDIANCLRLIDRKWNDIFREKLSINYRTWAKELMGVRNTVSHIGQNDLDQSYAERALDTMALLCDGFDAEGAEEIRTLYRTLRASDSEGRSIPMDGPSPIDIPVTSSKSIDFNTTGPINLIEMIDSDYVQKTTLTRKVTFAGQTAAYPVYKVRLDVLYYNDQNDRISTWITRYKAENGIDSIERKTNEEYNAIIENFIFESNPDSLLKTQKNISIVGQREPGVALADGRIVDGNRRFTCLRRIQRESTEPLFFETVIMDVDIQTDKKQIKLLELSIQHGEEKKVDYDLIDYAIGTYMDIEKTKLLTIEEYASSTNESISEVKKRIDIAIVINEFLEYLRVPEQFHIAREYQVYSIFQEMMPSLKQLNTEEREQLKKIVFNNVLLKALLDQRKFIRDIKLLIKNDTYTMYFEDQEEINERIHDKFDELQISTKEDLDKFARDNDAIAEELQISLQRALMRSRRQQLKAKPAENVEKSLSLLTEFNARTFESMDTDEKKHLKREMDHLSNLLDGYKAQLGTDTDGKTFENTFTSSEDISGTNKSGGLIASAHKKEIAIAKSKSDKPVVLCLDSGKKITTLSFGLSLSAIKENDNQTDNYDILANIVDESYEIISNTCECTVTVGDTTKCNFILNGSASEKKEVYLVIRAKEDSEMEAQRIIPIALDISFAGDFDF